MEEGRDEGSAGSFSIPFIWRIFSSKELCLFTCCGCVGRDWGVSVVGTLWVCGKNVLFPRPNI